jgi:hypothetical protein
VIAAANGPPAREPEAGRGFTSSSPRTRAVRMEAHRVCVGSAA